MQQPSVLTVILNYRTADLAIDAAAHALTAMEGLPGGIVLVDNDSQDGSFERMTAVAEARGWTGPEGRVRVLQAGRNGGYGSGNNYGMRAGLPDGSAPDFFYILNSDAMPEPAAIRELLKHMAQSPKCAFAGSFTYGVDGVTHCTCFRFPSILGELQGASRFGPLTRLLKRYAVPIQPVPEVTTPVDWVAGCSVLMRRAALDGVGMFDEDFFLYFEETDLCHRVKRAGWSVDYVPASRIVHIGHASTGMNLWKRVPDYWFESRTRYFTKNYGRLYAAGTTAALVTGLAIWSVKRMLTRADRRDPPGFVRDLIGHEVGLRRGITQERSKA